MSTAERDYFQGEAREARIEPPLSVAWDEKRQKFTEAVRRQAGIDPQDAYLFAATIRANLGIAHPDADEGRMREAIERVGLAPWLASLPDGLDTEVGECGAQVSGGQRQRIATARLLLSDARFLVLDEPTAHLDEAGARRLLGDLAADARRSGRATLVVTHEPIGLQDFDEVLTLREGEPLLATPRSTRQNHQGRPGAAKTMPTTLNIPILQCRVGLELA